MWRGATVLCLLLGAGATFGRAQHSAAAPHLAALDNKTLVIARDTDIISMDPDRAYEFTTGITNEATYQTLVTFDVNQPTKILQVLADRWTVQGAKVLTFHLNPKARFASGNPVTSAVVVWSFMRLKYLQDEPSFLMDPVQSVTAVDPSTVRITLKAPNAAFLPSLVFGGFSVLDRKLLMQRRARRRQDRYQSRVDQRELGRQRPFYHHHLDQQGPGGDGAQQELLGLAAGPGQDHHQAHPRCHRSPAGRADGGSP